MIPLCYVVTDEGIPRGVFPTFAEAERFKDRRGNGKWRVHEAPYYG